MNSNPRQRDKMTRHHFAHDTPNELEIRGHYNARGNGFHSLSISLLIANSTLNNHSLSNK